MLHHAQQLVGHQRQASRRSAAEQNGDPVLGLQAGEDVVAEAGLAHGGGQHRRADGQHRRRPHPGHDDRRSERRLDPPQPLAGGHADAIRSLQHGRLDPREASHSVPQDRQQPVEGERQQRRQEAQRGHGKAQPRLVTAESASSAG
jgi:hypothetical protein